MPLVNRLVNRFVGHPAADDQQAVDAVIFQSPAHGVELLDRGDLPAAPWTGLVPK